MADRSRLPKWAQDELARLERDVAHWKEVAGLADTETDTAVRHGLERQPLPNGARVEFGIAYSTAPNGFRSGRGIEVRWDERLGLLDVHSSEQVAVMPRASNSFVVRMVER